ncbi:hypothetical protein Dimus_018443 [Dionaea muscipula]
MPWPFFATGKLHHYSRSVLTTSRLLRVPRTRRTPLGGSRREHARNTYAGLGATLHRISLVLTGIHRGDPDPGDPDPSDFEFR